MIISGKGMSLITPNFQSENLPYQAGESIFIGKPSGQVVSQGDTFIAGKAIEFSEQLSISISDSKIKSNSLVFGHDCKITLSGNTTVDCKTLTVGDNCRISLSGNAKINVESIYGKNVVIERSDKSSVAYQYKDSGITTVKK